MVDQFIPSTPWFDQPDEWDKLQLSGETLPGDCKIRITRNNKFDRKIAKGEHGETQEYNGALAADVDIEIRLRNTDEYNAFLKLLPNYEPDPGKKEIKPHDLVHPQASARNVRSVWIESVDGPDIDGQYAIFRFNCFEHRAPTKKNAKGGKGASDACMALLVNHDLLLLRFANAQTETERFIYDSQIQINYQALVSLGCQQHAPPAGEPLGPPPDPNVPEKDPIDSFIDDVGDFVEEEFGL